jgi:hypothetical protein
MRHPIVLVVAAAVVASFALAPTVEARPRRRVRPASVLLVEAPLGLQGQAGAGVNVTIPFLLQDPTRRLAGVEMQYGVDHDGDGVIEESEFRAATEDRLDVRNTRRNKAPQSFTTSGGSGAWHAIVWKSAQDLRGARAIDGPQYTMDVHGRFVPNWFDPSTYEVSYVNPGVQVRLRAVSVSGATSAWTTSGSFSINNDARPSMAIDAVTVDPTSNRRVLVNWTAFDADSEDLNGNGRLDVEQGEDVDGDGVLDAAPVGVAFDWHRLAAGENPSAMTTAQLAALTWQPCTRDVAVATRTRSSSAPASRRRRRATSPASRRRPSASAATRSSRGTRSPTSSSRPTRTSCARRPSTSTARAARRSTRRSSSASASSSVCPTSASARRRACVDEASRLQRSTGGPEHADSGSSGRRRP